MSAEQNKAVVCHVLNELWKENFGIADKHPGIQEVVPFIQHIHQAMSDSQHEIVQQFADGEWVATRQITEATHTGNFMGMPPTGERIRSETLMFHRVVNGFIVKQHSQGGRIDRMQP